MKTLIQQLQDSEIAIKNDGSLKDLNRIIKTVRPEDEKNGLFDYYYLHKDRRIAGTDETELPSHSTSEFIKELDNQTITSMKTITSKQAQSIIDIACSGWKPRLAELWGKSIVLKNTIEIAQPFYKEMRKACTAEQNILFNKIFGKDEEYKVGDWIIGNCLGSNDYNYKKHPVKILSIDENYFTYDLYSDINVKPGYYNSKESSKKPLTEIVRLATPEEIKKAQYYPDGTACLVRDNIHYGWVFRYTNGNGEFYEVSKKSGDTSKWQYHMKLDINNLPVND
jgi:hypothetical protein